MKPDGWIARNLDGVLTVFMVLPFRQKDAKCWVISLHDVPLRGDNWILLPQDHPLGEGLTWEKGPKKVYLSLHSPEDVEALVGAAASAQKKTQMTVEYHVSKDTSITKDQVCKCWLCQIAHSLKKALKPFIDKK
jgi:hypothetical protein